MSSALALAPSTAGGESDPPAQHPDVEIITMRVVSAAEDAEAEPAVDTTSLSCPILLLPTSSLAKGMHVLLVQPTTNSPAAVPQASLVPASRSDDAPPVQQARDKDAGNSKAARELRGWLMVLATVIASVTYASGLNPPGGFQGGSGNRVTPVLRATSPRRYTTFYYCNTAAFALSLSIVLLVASQDLRRLAKIKVLEIIVALDVLALLMAYIVGSTFGLEELGVCAGLVLIVPVPSSSCRLASVGNTSGTNSEFLMKN